MASRRAERRATPSPSAVPDIAGYRELTEIGRGATATVYRAVQESFGRTVAIKVLHVDISDRRAQRRFEREREINGRLSNHPNVVTVLDSGLVDGRLPYLAMEFFEHGSSSERIARQGPFGVPDALHIGIRIAGALESAHALGVLHRDVKPQNILLSRFGEPALADFGVATILELEATPTAGLTPAHAAPELLEGADPTRASDVYALGSTVYSLLSGAPPFAGPPGEGVLAQLLRVTTMELPAMGRDDVAPSVLLALREATAKRPDDRTPTAVAFGRLLQMAQDDLGLARTALMLDGPLDVPVDVPVDAPSMPRHQAPAVARDPARWLPPATPPPPPPPPPPIAVVADDITLRAGEVADIDTPTMAASQVHPAADAPARRPRHWVVLGAVGAIAIGLGAFAGNAISTGRRWQAEIALETVAPETPAPETEEPGVGKNDLVADSVAAGPGSSAADPVGTVPILPGDPDDWAPGGVRLVTDGDPRSPWPTLEWDDMSGGLAGHVVVADRRVDGWENVYVEPGVSAIPIELDPDTDVCFQVSAVVAIGDAIDDAVRAVGEPDWVCLAAEESSSAP